MTNPWMTLGNDHSKSRKPDSPVTAATLRRRAEARLRERQGNHGPGVGGQLSEADTQRLLHELQVHQIELEMQNEELSRAHAQAEACAEKFSDLYDFAPIGYVSLDGDGCIEEINFTAAKLLGRPRSALAGTPLVRGLVQRDKNAFLRHLRTCSETETQVTGEFDLGSDDGRMVPVQLCTVYRRDQTTQTRHYLTAITDLTGRKQAEQAVQEAHDRVIAVLESITDGFFGLDHDFRLTYVNREAETLLGKARQELLGRNLWQVFPAAADSRFQRECARAMTANQVVHFEEFLPPFQQWFEVHAYPSPIGLSVYLQDVTRRKQAEEGIRQLNTELEARVYERTATIRKLASELTLAEQREKSRLAQVLHDHLQQLLFGARFLLADAGQNAAARDQETLRRVDQVLSQCIEASRDLSVELCPPILQSDGLAAALKWLGRWMRERHGLTVKVTAGRSPARLAEASSVLLYQALRELLFNVVKHAGVKSARLAVSWGEAQVSVVVSDQGKGFDPIRLQTDDSPSAGFGLFSVRERLGLLGGQMEIESAPGQGSRFTLRMPLGQPLQRKPGRRTKGNS